MKKQLFFVMAALLLVTAGIAQPTLTLTAGNCWNPSGPNTLTATISNNTGTSTYSWSSQGPGCNDTLISVSGFDAVFQLNCCGTHTVTCQVYNGSTLCCVATGTVLVGCTPTVTAVPSLSAVCLGGTSTITASGAAAYSWSNLMTTAVIVVTPSVATCYTVVGTDAQGCTDDAVVCIGLNPLPNITIQNNSPTLCQGTFTTISAFGGISYTWMPGSFMGGNLPVVLNSNTCYTVTGSDGTCTNTASTCFTVLPTPTLLATNFATVCLGSSITLTASTAASYTWFTTPPVNTSTVNVLPASLTQYTVAGTGSNGCSSVYTIQVTPDPNCAMVWPGDANSDGVVNGTDVIELGLYNGSTGPARSPGGITYNAQFANAWTGTGSNSQNRCHVDCNGDGTVNAGDTLAILTNFSLTHSFRVSAGNAGDDVWIAAPPYIANTGGWYKADIGLGSATNTIQNVYGVEFDVQYQSSYVENDEVYVVYPPSFLSAGNQNIPFRRLDAGSSQVNCVTVRTDGNSVSGQGMIAEFWFKGKLMAASGTMTVSLSNVKVYDDQGNPTTLNDAGATIHVGPVGIGQHAVTGYLVFPNPARNELTVFAGNGKTAKYVLTDLTGRQLGAGTVYEKGSVDISALAAGTYVITFDEENQKTSKRFIKE